MFNEFENASTPVHITGISEYLCGHNILLAHKNVYRLYEKDFKSEQNGINIKLFVFRVYIVDNIKWFNNNTIIHEITRVR